MRRHCCHVGRQKQYIFSPSALQHGRRENPPFTRLLKYVYRMKEVTSPRILETLLKTHWSSYFSVVCFSRLVNFELWILLRLGRCQLRDLEPKESGLRARSELHVFRSSLYLRSLEFPHFSTSLLLRTKGSPYITHSQLTGTIRGLKS